MSQGNDESILVCLKNGHKESFSTYELSRWFGMIEAIDYLTEFANSKNIDIGEFTKKPAAIYDYINRKQPQLQEEIENIIRRFKRADDSIFL